MIVTYDEIKEIARSGELGQTVFRGGCYDILHTGHLHGLEFAASLGNTLMVGIVTDSRVRDRKGPERPFQHEEERLELINAFACVDYAFLLPKPQVHGRSPTLQVANELRPSCICLLEAEDYSKWTESEIKNLGRIGVEIVYDKSPKLQSTSSIIDRIRGS